MIALIGWLVLAGVLGLLALLLLIPVRLGCAYQNGAWRAQASYLFLRFKFSPEALADRSAKEQKEKLAREKQKKKEEGKEEAKRTRSVLETLSLLAMLLRSATHGLHTLRRHLVFTDTTIGIRVCGSDAQHTAEKYAQLSACVWVILGQIGSVFPMKEPKVFIVPDFTGAESVYNVSLNLQIRPLFVVAAGFSFLWYYLKNTMFNKNKRHSRGKSGSSSKVSRVDPLRSRPS